MSCLTEIKLLDKLQCRHNYEGKVEDEKANNAITTHLRETCSAGPNSMSIHLLVVETFTQNHKYELVSIRINIMGISKVVRVCLLVQRGGPSDQLHSPQSRAANMAIKHLATVGTLPSISFLLLQTSFFLSFLEITKRRYLSTNL